MNIKNLTDGQKEALLISLSNQSSPMTTGEKSLLKQLKEDAIEIVETAKGWSVQKLGNKVRQINIDTFGEDYRNCWVKLQESGKGIFFYSAYFGKRIYLKD
jgi:hypothetical protein